MSNTIYHLTSSVCSEKELLSVAGSDLKISQSIQKYFRVVCNGFVKNSIPIKVFSRRPVTKTGKLFFRAKDTCEEGINYHYCAVLNIRIIGNIYSVLCSFFWYLLPRNCKKEDIVFVDPLNVSIALGCSLACRIRGITTIQFITDVPQYYVMNKGNKMALNMKLSSKIESLANGYILITEAMNTVVNKQRRPYCVTEGFVDEDMAKKEIRIEEKYKSKVIMYTGGLRAVYGLDMLIDGFLKANISESELHIYGYGDYEEEIQKISKRYSNVKFFGSVENSIIVQEQMKATLLVNPRYTNEEYTKFSFPGKNMEYAASGTPILTTKLPGMPKEYYPHVFIIQNETADGIAEALTEILQKTPEELFEFGKQTKQWVLSKKNNRIQVDKILHFLDENYEELHQ